MTRSRWCGLRDPIPPPGEDWAATGSHRIQTKTTRPRERRDLKASAAKQLAAEIEWLEGRYLPDWALSRLPEPSPAERDIVERVRGILNDPRLVPVLRMLEKHNSCPRVEPGARTPSKARLLLGPHLRQVLASVQGRGEMRQKLPVLDQPAAEVRKHLQDASAGCRCWLS